MPPFLSDPVEWDRFARSPVDAASPQLKEPPTERVSLLSGQGTKIQSRDSGSPPSGVFRL